MKRKGIYELLSDENKSLADQMIPRLLKERVCESMLTPENSDREEDHPDRGIHKLKCEFIKGKMSEEWGSWNAYWKRMGNQFNNFFPNYWQFQAVALYLKIDLKVVRIQATGSVSVDHYLKHNTFITSYIFEAQCQKLDITKTLLIGKKTDIHFQSLLEHQKEAKESEKETKEDVAVKSECPNCHKLFENPLKHISRSSCKNKIDDNVVLELKEKAMSKHKAENKVRKARSRKKLQMHETFQEREERLLTKRKLSKKLRESLLKTNPEDLRMKEKSKKRLSRIKQRQENPDYENPRFKEKDIYENILEENDYSKKERKYKKLQEILFGQETFDDWVHRCDKEKEIYGKETWDQKIERYEKTVSEIRMKKQQKKEQEFKDRNKDTFSLKLSSFDT